MISWYIIVCRNNVPLRILRTFIFIPQGIYGDDTNFLQPLISWKTSFCIMSFFLLVHYHLVVKSIQTNLIDQYTYVYSCFWAAKRIQMNYNLAPSNYMVNVDSTYFLFFLLMHMVMVRYPYDISFLSVYFENLQLPINILHQSRYLASLLIFYISLKSSHVYSCVLLDNMTRSQYHLQSTR